MSEQFTVSQQWLNTHLVFEHTDFLLFAKPEGVGFHTEDDQQGFFDCLRQAYHTCYGEIELFPVHRLDKMTSGLILVAKSKAAAAQFGSLFENHAIEKYYVALAMGKPKKKQGTIKGDMQRGRRSSWMLTATQNNPAVTCFKSFALPSVVNGLRLYLLQPRTGKTHQIRVMMKSIGTAILGDPTYAEQSSIDLRDRGYLHAFALRFLWQGDELTFVLPPTSGKLFSAPDCQSTLQSLAKPWELTWPKL